MDTKKFWAIIDKSLSKSDNSLMEQLEALEEELKSLDTEDILEFKRILEKMLIKAYTSDLWAAAYIINKGASDDSFEYFRCFLISRGQKIFEKVVKDPDSFADINFDALGLDEYEFELFEYVPANAYEIKTSKKDFYKKLGKAEKLPDIKLDWDEDNEETLKKKLPKLFNKYWNVEHDFLQYFINYPEKLALRDTKKWFKNSPDFKGNQPIKIEKVFEKEFTVPFVGNLSTAYLFKCTFKNGKTEIAFACADVVNCFQNLENDGTHDEMIDYFYTYFGWLYASDANYKGYYNEVDLSKVSQIEKVYDEYMKELNNLYNNLQYVKGYRIYNDYYGIYKGKDKDTNQNVYIAVEIADDNFAVIDYDDTLKANPLFNFIGSCFYDEEFNGEDEE